ncbi:hypothetical protein D3C80_1597490 [compost metagenome]
MVIHDNQYVGITGQNALNFLCPGCRQAASGRIVRAWCHNQDLSAPLQSRLKRIRYETILIYRHPDRYITHTADGIDTAQKARIFHRYLFSAGQITIHQTLNGIHGSVRQIQPEFRRCIPAKPLTGKLLQLAVNDRLAVQAGYSRNALQQ